MDKILVKNLSVRNIIGVDSWERSKRQPLTISITVHQALDASGETDLLSQTISYGTVAKVAQEFSERTAYRSVEALASGIARVCVRECGAPRVTVRVEKPRALLHAACAGVEITRTKEDVDVQLALEKDHTAAATAASVGAVARRTFAPTRDVPGEDKIFIDDLTLSTIIGVNPWEREERQRVVISIVIHLKFDSTLLVEDHVPKVHNYRTITRSVSNYVESTDYKTVEALATSIARLLIQQCHVPKVTVRVEKPSAIVFAAAAGVEITRDKAYFELEEESDARSTTVQESAAAASSSKAVAADADDARLPHVAYIALGTNLGDRGKNIEDALQKLEGSPAVKLLDTSFLYETAPMYVVDQPSFFNACIKIRTSLEPEQLLSFLKGIESEHGRDFAAQRNGPRPIDLDILTYDALELNNQTLTIPHPRIKEREFVLRPLCDIAPDMEIPGLFRTASQLLALLAHTAPKTDDVICKVLVGGHGLLWKWGRRTYVMGILNVTPDSFSDGGKHNESPAVAAQHALHMVKAGADMIDIGGCSTRPGASEVPEQDEIDRVVPVIEEIRKLDSNVAISVDTFRASVAKAAVEAGADLINDVTAGAGDAEMVATMARLRVPVCLMHMRGTPKTMTTLTNYTDATNPVPQIRAELASNVAAALTAGVRRWNIILDPGIGFAKTADHSFRIISNLPELVAPATPLAGFPTLVGPSRKRFLVSDKDAASDDPAQRVYATAAACSAAISKAADVLRVHDVREMKDVVRVADRCFRSA
ncbi:trifunctional dihydropteroate synthetase [Geranomyces michiganensis]|nr:trifunctional dihydropteroate synthetase [Geranomyces michiganensis]